MRTWLRHRHAVSVIKNGHVNAIMVVTYSGLVRMMLLCNTRNKFL